MERLRAYLDHIQPLPEATWEAVQHLLIPLQLPKGAFFAEKGDHSADLGFLLSGSLRAFSRNDEGKDYNKSFFVAPTLFGALSALVTGRPNQIWIQAMEPCTLFRIPHNELEALYDRHPLLERLARKFAERLFVAKETREIELVTMDAKARYQRFQEQYPGLENRIPQYHIASFLGVTPTQLSRIRAGLSHAR